MKFTSFRLNIALVVALTAWATQAQAQSYAFTALGSLGGLSSGAKAINSLGQVVGYSMDNSGVQQAVVWNGGAPTALGDGGYGSVSGAYGYAINNAGVVVGNAYNGLGAPVVWQNGAVTSLPVFDGVSGYAYGINDAGQIAGTANAADDQSSVAAVWQVGSSAAPTVLPGLGGLYTQASAINNAGQVVGASMDADNHSHSVVWNGNTAPTVLGDIGDQNSLGSGATAVSESGLVAGVFFENVFFHAVAWGLDGRPVALSEMGGIGSSAFGINSHGQVVGSFSTFNVNTGTADFFAALWDAQTGQGVNLNSLLSPGQISEGIVLTSATGINDSGFIVGQYHNTVTGIDGAFELQPVPEPATYVLFLLGLGGLAAAVRRKQAVL